MNCPRCNTSRLEELDRDGITIDRCTSCRGVWLDRGELERLTTRVQESERGRVRDRGDEFDEDSDVGGHRRGRGRRSWLDIFD